MNAAAWEYTMGNMINTSGTFYPGSANSLWSTTITPLDKYYDKYSYSSSADSVASQTRSKLGDGIKEIRTATSGTTTNWYSNYRSMFSSTTPWLIRGGSTHYNDYAGVYYVSKYSGVMYVDGSTRPTLVITNKEEN